MITLISDVPDNVAAFRATGNVNKDDYKNVVIPAIDALVKKQGKINFMLVLDTAIRNFSIGAFLQDIGVGLKHFSKWHRMAIVSESNAINKLSDLFSYIAPGETRGFFPAEIEKAKDWVSAD